MQSSIYSVIRFNNWADNYGCQRAGLPPDSLDALRRSSTTFQGMAMALRNDMLHVRSTWQSILGTPSGEQGTSMILKLYIKSLTVELYNLKLLTSNTVAQASQMKVQVMEANALVAAYVRKDNQELAKIDQDLIATQQHMQLAKAQLAAANAELSGASGFWNGFITGITMGIYNRIKEEVDKANRAVSRYNSELTNQYNLRNQQVRIINERGQANNLLASLVNVDSMTTDFQNALNEALAILTDAYTNEEKLAAASGGAAKYYFNAVGKNMDKLFIWIDRFYSDNGGAMLRQAAPSDVCSAVRGDYECHVHDLDGKNDWHYVTIVKLSDTSVMWTNRAGVNWILNQSTDISKLNTSNDCPYYENHKQATVVWKGNMVTGIIGPGDELYEKTSD